MKNNRGDYVFSDRWARYGLSMALPVYYSERFKKAFECHELVRDWLDTHEDDRIQYDVKHDYFRILGLAEGAKKE